MTTLLPILYCLILAGNIGFQIGLIAGMPWGRITQGGFHEGALPASGRIMAALSIFILAAMGLAILSVGGAWPGWPMWTAWVALGVNTLSMLANWFTPSGPERRLWGPVTTIMLLIALAVVLPAYL